MQSISVKADCTYIYHCASESYIWRNALNITETENLPAAADSVTTLELSLRTIINATGLGELIEREGSLSALVDSLATRATRMSKCSWRPKQQ